MSARRILQTLGYTLLTTALLSCNHSGEKNTTKEDTEVKKNITDLTHDAKALLQEKEAQKIAIDAYIYTYPLVTMDYTRRFMTNVVTAQGSKAPMGQFAKLRDYPAADDHSVTAPNADTLYTLAWLDVSQEPWIISTPNMKDRYFLLPILDAWTTVFADPGKRTTGTGAQKFAITGPDWRGTLPPGVKEYKSATNLIWLLGRIYCTGTPEDYKEVHALQDQISAVPLSAYGKPYTPPAGVVDPSIDMKTAVRTQVDALDAETYFKLAARLMKKNPPTAEDAPMVAKLAKIGIVAGHDFDITKLDPLVAKGLLATPRLAQKKIMSWMKEGLLTGDFKLMHGWLFTTKTGLYGKNYRQRALITAIGLGANRPQDAVYPTSEGPTLFKTYNGANKYLIHFKHGEMPPVKGFWSLTLYDENYFFVPNSLNRYTVSQRDKFKKNIDGSVDIYIQHESPGKEKEANWLPAPSGKFILMMRFYWPKETPPSLLDGSWKIPPVKQIN